MRRTSTPALAQRKLRPQCQYRYWGETVRYNEKLSYAGQLENREFAKETHFPAALVLGQGDYIAEFEAIQAAYQERGIQEAVAEQQLMYEARGICGHQASAQEGKSMDRYVRDVDRQIGDYSALKQIKDGMAARQYSRQQLGQLTKYLNQYNSQQFYVKAPIQKPTMPFPPLPAMVTPPQPYMRGAAPADTRFLDNATTAFGALNTGFETNKMIMNMAAGKGSASNPLLRLNSLLGGTGGKA